MTEQLVLEVGGKRYEVPESFMTSLNQIQAKLLEAGVPEDKALTLAFENTQIAFGNAKVAKKDKPEEIVPDLAELARPFVEAALEKNKGTQKAIQSYLDAQQKLADLLAEAGLDTDLELGGGKQNAAAFIWLEKDWEESDDVMGVRVKVKRESALAQAALGVNVAYRGATSAIKAIVDRVAEKEGIKSDGRTDIVSVNPDGSVSLTAPRRKSTKREGGNGGSRSTYVYSFDESTKEHVITADGTEWVRSNATTEDELLAAIKVEYLKTHDAFAPMHWRGSKSYPPKSWWPFPAASS